MSRPPEMWLIGCTQSLERQGLNPKDAIREALRIWAEQEQCEAEHKADRREDR